MEGSLLVTDEPQAFVDFFSQSSEENFSPLIEEPPQITNGTEQGCVCCRFPISAREACKIPARSVVL